MPQEAGDWEPAASDFPARTWRGEDRGRLEGPCPAAPRPESSASGASGTARWPGKQGFGAARCSIMRCAPPEAPSLLLGCKGQPRSNCPGSVPARRPPPGREATSPRRDTGPCVPSPTLRARGSRWSPGEGRGGIRAAGGSFGTRGERDRRPASRRRTREPGDPAIDRNREAAVYSNTAPPGQSPGDAERPGAPSAWRGRPPSSLHGGLGLPGPAAATPAA